MKTIGATVQAPQPPSSRLAEATPIVSSSRLFGAAQTVFIDHAGQRYTLRITRENKLILTK
jgi:hemin uptake protein HemP